MIDNDTLENIADSLSSIDRSIGKMETNQHYFLKRIENAVIDMALSLQSLRTETKEIQTNGN